MRIKKTTMTVENSKVSKFINLYEAYDPNISEADRFKQKKVWLQNDFEYLIETALKVLSRIVKKGPFEYADFDRSYNILLRSITMEWHVVDLFSQEHPALYKDETYFDYSLDEDLRYKLENRLNVVQLLHRHIDYLDYFEILKKCIDSCIEKPLRKKGLIRKFKKDTGNDYINLKDIDESEYMHFIVEAGYKDEKPYCRLINS